MKLSMLMCAILGAGVAFSQPISPDEIFAPTVVGVLPCAKPVRPLKDWHDLVAEWDCDKGTVRFLVDGKVYAEQKLAWISEAGLSYLHLQTLAEESDALGSHFRVFWAE